MRYVEKFFMWRKNEKYVVWSQAPEKESVVSAIKLVITVPHLSIHIHLESELK